MAQVAIREYDAKRLWNQYNGQSYDGILVEKDWEEAALLDLLSQQKSEYFVIKPDQLFGKRGKYGLVGVKLTSSQVVSRLSNHRNKTVRIEDKEDVLNTFLIEPYIAHEEEFYLGYEATRSADILTFSQRGGIEVEEYRDGRCTLEISVNEQLTEKKVSTLLGTSSTQETLVSFVIQFFSFCREQGLTAIEVNPLTVVDGEAVCLDMVAHVDSCEFYRQAAWKDTISWVKPFGTHSDPVEELVEELDHKTGASLKLHILNPDGRIRLLLGGGGASVITMDSLSERGLIDQVANYGELSGNPDTDANRSYALLLIKQMLFSKASDKYFLVIGGIANFTSIKSLFDGLCDAIDVHHEEIVKQGIRFLVRRGGIDDQVGLRQMTSCCERYGIPLIAMDGTHYMTDIFSHLS